MALPAVTRAVFANRNQIKQFMSEGSRNLSLGSRVHARTQSLKCLKWTTSQSNAVHATVHGRSPLYRSCESNGDENSRATSNWTYTMGSVIAFSLFSKAEEDTRTDAQKKEDEIILLLKRAKLSMMRGQLHGANGFLHQAIALAHQSNNTQAIIYTYSLMANLAYVQGHLDNAEKLFKVAMSFMLSGGTPQDDNGVIEMSLKLATIYAGQEKNDLAKMGFQFCTESLEAKLEKFNELPAEEQSEELRKETRLLLGLTLDSHARYMVAIHRLSQAVVDYKQALLICQEEQGQTHPQSLVLMSDLATILDMQGRHDEALPLVKQAVELSREAGHPDQHVLLGNMAGILLHNDLFEESVKVYKEALALAQSAGDEEAVEQIQEGLKEVGNRRKAQKAEAAKNKTD
ncbi:tetratricopeptide repeat protein 19, mitochondrial isoform X1 [Salmo salar]|uniref:Tetratricopeptide repeat protein 19, mitochondrial isoform X1 n=2 Tax=Salmo salar TaxID=8030 RepID=A0A1S3QUU1_SALSA|nr:tetratricopeptide repeat protein 19, mitochondrial isoform X1 [Salmo salar]|eukprot:XP_014043888.1 PREDICTED: tetratricopeptide repeat protein 19, mitochondrial-like [Salmo salar]